MGIFDFNDLLEGEFIEKNKHRGYVSRIFKSSEKWSAGIFYDTEYNETFKFIAYFKIYMDEPVVFVGEWVDNTYNGETSRQFVAHYIEKDIELTEESLYKFLKNNSKIKGIGEKFARKIANKFWKDFDKIITESPHIIAHDLHINLDIIKNLQKIWLEDKQTNLTNIKLSKLPLSQNLINKIINFYGTNSYDIIKKNPYKLIKYIKGYNFYTADEIAIYFKWQLDSKERIEAALNYILIDEIQNGYDGSHCWIEINELIDNARNLLNINESYIVDFLKNNEDKFKIYEFENELRVSHIYTYYQEEYVVNYLNKIKDSSLLCNPDKVYQEYLNDLEILNNDQKQCIKNALNYDLSIISGQAGTGKTFVIKYLLKIFKSLNYNVCLIAPTGKAARRITESTGFLASTIHKLLNYNTLEYGYNIDNKLYDYDIYVIDEFSMVNNDLAFHLFSAFPNENIKIILVGDHNQLPPIGPGLLFTKLIECQKYDYHITTLNNIIRQAGELKLNSVEILKGNFKIKNSNDWQINTNFKHCNQMVEYLSTIFMDSQKTLGFDSDDIQVISPIKKGECGVYNLNIQLQKIIQKYKYNIDVKPVKNIIKPKFYLNDRVVQTVNDYDIDVMNGTLGKIIYYDENSEIMKIKFENNICVEYEKNDEKLDNVSLAYALTVHKVQGSEFPCIVIVMHQSHFIMLNKKLLYTAVTRAKQKLLLITNHSAINIAMSNNNNIVKKTNYDYIISSN